MTQLGQDARDIDIFQRQSVSKVQTTQNLELNHLYCYRNAINEPHEPTKRRDGTAYHRGLQAFPRRSPQTV